MTSRMDRKPGTVLIGVGLVVFALWAVAFVIGLTQDQDTDPQLQHFVVPALALLLAGIGYARRLLHAVENR